MLGELGQKGERGGLGRAGSTGDLDCGRSVDVSRSFPGEEGWEARVVGGPIFAVQ